VAKEEPPVACLSGWKGVKVGMRSAAGEESPEEISGGVCSTGEGKAMEQAVKSRTLAQAIRVACWKAASFLESPLLQISGSTLLPPAATGQTGTLLM
jgi:hypothetical protein